MNEQLIFICHLFHQPYKYYRINNLSPLTILILLQFQHPYFTFPVTFLAFWFVSNYWVTQKLLSASVEQHRSVAAYIAGEKSDPSLSSGVVRAETRVACHAEGQMEPTHQSRKTDHAASSPTNWSSPSQPSIEELFSWDFLDCDRFVLTIWE